MSARSDADKYRHRLSPYTERSTAKVTDGSSVFLSNLGTKVRRIVEKQCKDIATTVKTILGH